MRNKLYAVALLGLSMFFISSCGSEKSNYNSNVQNEILSGEIGFDSNGAQDSSCYINPYFDGNYPAIKYVNEHDKLNIEVYLGFGKLLLDTLDYNAEIGNIYFDSDQELTLTLYRRIEWHTSISTSKTIPTQPIIKEVFEFNQTLGYFMSNQFDKSLKNFKYDDTVTLDDLKENYYETVFDNEYVLEEDENGELYKNYDLSRYRSYATLSYYFRISCDDNDYIKYYFINDTGFYNPFDQKNSYDTVNCLHFSSIGFVVNVIDDKIIIGH